MKAFIVHAHPEPKSFNAALTRHAVDVLTGAGHEVVVSDLYAMGFDPVSDRRNFTTVKEPDSYKQQIEEMHATENDGFSPDIAAEQLFACDTLIFQFPLWWFGLPAILKGWVDRVLAMGKTYGGGRWYDRGVFSGKRAMLSLTTGGPESIYEADGLNGHIREVLYPVNHGIFYFTGFEVLPPFVAYAPAHVGDEGRAKYLAAWRELLLSLDSVPPLLYPTLDEYDESFRLKPPPGA